MNIADKNLNLKKFYLRRIKRTFPALLFLLSILLPVTMLIMDLKSNFEIIKAAIFALFGSLN